MSITVVIAFLLGGILIGIVIGSSLTVRDVRKGWRPPE